MTPISWSPPPNSLRLRENEIHIWLARLEQDRSTTSRGVLLSLLSRYLRVPPDSIQITTSEFGKLKLADSSLGLRFNLSHSEDTLLLAFAMNQEIGVDIEKVRESYPYEKLANRLLNPTEAQELEKLPIHARRSAFFQIWTRKEAYVKATGKGISSLTSLSIPADTWIQSFEVAPEFQGSVALEVAPAQGKAPLLFFWKF